MKGRPWYKRYPADILHGTMALTVAEKGAYNVVLDLMYDRGGPILDDAKWLARQCGCSMQLWRTLRTGLIDHGKLVVTEDGRLTNERATREIARNEAEAESLREAGRAGGLAKKYAENVAVNSADHSDNNGLAEKGLNLIDIVDTSGDATTKLAESSRFVGTKLDLFGEELANNNSLAEKGLEAVPETRVLDRKEGRKISSLRSDSCPPLPGGEPDGFPRFYRAYPRKDSRTDACRAYVKALKTASEEEIFSGLIGYQFSSDRHYQPMAATWLNKGRWQHEPDTPPPSTETTVEAPSKRMAAFNLLRVYKQGGNNG